MGMIDKMMHFWWVVNIISINREETSWVVDGQGVKPQQISKNLLNFEAKV